MPAIVTTIVPTAYSAPIDPSLIATPLCGIRPIIALTGADVCGSNLQHFVFNQAAA
jgi:hypothetical protein